MPVSPEEEYLERGMAVSRVLAVPGRLCIFNELKFFVKRVREVYAKKLPGRGAVKNKHHKLPGNETTWMLAQ